MNYLTFALDEVGDGQGALEAMASTRVGQHPEVLAEVEQVLAWAWEQFPDSHGPLDEGMDWQHDLQIVVEDGGWHTVSLAIGGSPRFVERFLERFGSTGD